VTYTARYVGGTTCKAEWELRMLDRDENVSMTIDLNHLTTSNNASRAAGGDVGKNEQFKAIVRPPIG
jgi:hypothetical protein